MNTILGEKLGMTQIFDAESRAVPVTVVKAGPVKIVQIKRDETDGYSAVQLAFKELALKQSNRPLNGHFAKAGLPPHKHVLEVRVDDPDEYEVGQVISVADVLHAGTRADVTGITKGKGFAGSIKRHGFRGQGASHGAHKVHRAPGAIGACATPSRVFKGKRMPGRMGGDQRTIQSVEIVEVDAERGLVMLRGAIPGPKGSVVVIREGVKSRG